MLPRSARALRSRFAFTLIELLMVISIVGVIAAFGFKIAQFAFNKSALDRANAELRLIGASLESYRIALGDYPRTSDPAVLLQSLIGKRGPTGQVIESRSHVDAGQMTIGAGRDPYTTPTAEMVDPWAQSYRYTYKPSTVWARSGYMLFSSGPDQLHAPLSSGGQVDSAVAENRDNVYSER